MSYKNLQHYRFTVHRYLDAIWTLSSRKNKARTSMYKWLSYKMNVDEKDAHVKCFDRATCRKAIKILRPLYIQLYGKDLDYVVRDKGEVDTEREMRCEKMFYSSKTTRVFIAYDKPDGKRLGSCWYITVYCKSRELDKDGRVYDFTKWDGKLIQSLGVKDLNSVFDFNITLENVAKWIWEQVLPCYKVEIKTENGELVVYEEDRN